MELLTIGAFARAARLTPKALRLYDELGLLVPAAVDAESGYRYYDPEQLDEAELIARLRGIGMPLAEIAAVQAMPPDAAATAVAAYWQRVAAETADRARLAALLVQRLSGRGTMSENLQLRYAAGSDIGTVRDHNQDIAYAGERLLAVADGAGGPGGAAAAAAAVDALKPLQAVEAPAAELLSLLATAVDEADAAVRKEATAAVVGETGAAAVVGEAATSSEVSRPITTLTALVRSGSRLALVHIGDTRAYLLRNGELSRLTTDHTWVRSEVERGRLAPEEAATHPQRALLVRALGAGGRPVEADLALRTALPGDRYLLCSDGLFTVIDGDPLRDALVAAEDPEAAVRDLIGRVRSAGAPDNIACVVADVVTA